MWRIVESLYFSTTSHSKFPNNWLNPKKKVAYHLYILRDKRDTLNERKINTGKKSEVTETIKNRV